MEKTNLVRIVKIILITIISFFMVSFTFGAIRSVVTCEYYCLQRNVEIISWIIFVITLIAIIIKKPLPPKEDLKTVMKTAFLSILPLLGGTIGLIYSYRIAARRSKGLKKYSFLIILGLLIVQIGLLLDFKPCSGKICHPLFSKPYAEFAVISTMPLFQVATGEYFKRRDLPPLLAPMLSTLAVAGLLFMTYQFGLNFQ